MSSRRIIVLTFTALLVLGSCSSDKPRRAAQTPTTGETTSTLPPTPVTGMLFSPEQDSVQGIGGVGMVVDLAFRTTDEVLLPAQPRLNPAAARPGRNAAFPGLVVTLSTTGESLGGPAANLADLFQIIGVSKQPDGSTQVWATWSNARPDFGVDVDATLEAYVLRDQAPASVPPDRASLDILSNVVSVSFHVAAPTPGASVPLPDDSTTTTSAVTRTTRTTRVVRTTTTARQNPPTTTATTTPVTTTATTTPATTSTTS